MVARRQSAVRVEALARAFRTLPVPAIGRVHDGVFYLDLRCLDDEKLFRNQLERLQPAADRLPEEKTLEWTGEN